MRDRVARMQRVAAVRALRERIDEAANVLAAAKVRAVEVALARVDASRAAALKERSSALLEGDRAGLLLADSMREVAGWQRDRLESLRAARVVEAETSLLELRASRMKREQAETMLRGSREVRTRAEERMAQAQSDDRFLARRHWNIGPRA